ncbi:MAG: lytic transglycosylase domain-containing protein [Xanthobacteraceae bacterium]
MAFSASLSARADINAKHRPEHRALREGHKQGSTSVTKRSETEIPLPVARPPLANLPSDSEAEIPLPIARPTLANLPSDSGAEITLPIARPTSTNLPPDLTTVKQALDLIGRDKLVEATAIEKSTSDPVAKKLVEWALLRRADSGVSFQRYNAFITANPNWPSIKLLRKRAEAILWMERADGAARSFFADQPTSAVGRLVLARLLTREGDRAGAAREVRAVWRAAQLSAEVETAVLAEFPDALNRLDHLGRMDQRIGAKDLAAALRAAKRVGEDQVAIVKACSAAAEKSAKTGRLLDAVPSRARDDLGYALCRIHWLLRNDSPGFNIRGRLATPKEDVALAVKLALGASQEELEQQDTDAWWRERRALARKLLDLNDAASAYQVVTKSALPANPYYRAEFHFMAGWIALQFLHDPGLASKHFALIAESATDPRIQARAAYWQGRAAEAAGELTEMRTRYEAASHYPIAYYGQLARDRLGLGSIALPPLSEAPDLTGSELLSAAGILYAIDERDLAQNFVSDIAKESSDVSLIAALAKLSAQFNDAQATLVIGEKALERGMGMEQYAFPDFGVPSFKTMGATLDRCVVYSVVRTESGFNQGDRSSASAVGLMQVTPQAGRDTAKRLRISYDWRRLVSDTVYNTELGAGEVGDLLGEYRGSYILTFAAYNAGRGRVAQWMAIHGDPRDPKVDPVDWVERIPFAETRNYVQRVMENLQVYRARFGPDCDKGAVRPNLASGAVAHEH